MIVIAIRINIARNETEQTIGEQANESNKDKKSGNSGRDNSKREGRRMELEVVDVGKWKWKK